MMSEMSHERPPVTIHYDDDEGVYTLVERQSYSPTTYCEILQSEEDAKFAANCWNALIGFEFDDVVDPGVLTHEFQHFYAVFPIVVEAATGGRMSKLNYTADAYREEIASHHSRLADEAVEDAMAELRQDLGIADGISIEEAVRRAADALKASAAFCSVVQKRFGAAIQPEADRVEACIRDALGALGVGPAS